MAADRALSSVVRRRWLLGGVAAAAGAGGAGLAWWHHSPGPMASDAEAALWSLALETPAGVAQPMRRFRGQPTLLNFWATWCPPCVEELPLLNRFYRENAAKGWQVVGLAVDQAPAVTRFLGKSPVDFPVLMAGLAGVELSKSLGNLSGGLPFTLVLGGEGRVLHRKMGQVSIADLRLWSTLR